MKKLPKSQIELEIKLPISEFQNFVDRAISQLGQNLEIEGFRKGKIPKEILEKKVGQEKILKEAAESAIRKNYIKIISENKIEAISQPEIEILSPLKVDGELFCRIKVFTLPEIVLPDYKKIAANCKKQEISVKEKEIESALSWLQRSRAKFSQVSRPAQKGDFVEIEFFSPHIENGAKKKDAFVLGQGHLIPGFEGNLEKMEANQEKEFSLQFPKEHFQKNLAGQKMDFKVKMLSVQKMELPEINDGWARNLGQFEDLGSLRRNITQGLNLEKEIQEKQRLRQEILEKIIKEVSWEIPEILIETEKKRMFENFKQDIANRFQTNFEEYLKKINQTEEQLLKSFQSEAETRVKSFLVLNKISQVENIKVPEEETKTEVNKVLNKYPNIEQAKKEVDFEKLKLYIKGELKNEKTLQILERLASSQ